MIFHGILNAFIDYDRLNSFLGNNYSYFSIFFSFKIYDIWITSRTLYTRTVLHLIKFAHNDPLIFNIPEANYKNKSLYVFFQTSNFLFLQDLQKPSFNQILTAAWLNVN